MKIDLFPRFFDHSRIADIFIAKNVRVTKNEFVANLVAHIGYVECRFSSPILA